MLKPIQSFFLPKGNAKVIETNTGIASSPSKKRKIIEEDVSSKRKSTLADVMNESHPSLLSSIRPTVSDEQGVSRSGWRNAFENMEPSWKEAMRLYLSNKSAKDNLISFLEKEEAAGKVVYPHPADVFSFMRSCPIDKVKVVIVGQDPYHGPGQAHGMCFSVRKGVQVPPSLRNMLLEASQDKDIEPKVRGNAGHGDLSKWSQQGVLLLNTCLTVRKGEPLSHKSKGWEEFTDQVIMQCTRRNNLVYLCWGKEAQNKCAKVNTSTNLVVSSSHPSPLGAYKTAAPFMGSKCFSRCNEWLVRQGKAPIDWNI